MKIFCIGRNYEKHAKELNNQIPDKPLVFMKPSTALLKNGSDFFYPNFTKDLHHECELVLKVGKNGKHIKEKFAFEYISEITVGIDFTARDVQTELKQKGHSWEIAKAFDHSAPVGDFISVPPDFDWRNINIKLEKNSETVQQGNTKNLIFPIPYLLAHISTFFTLQKGDLIFTGTPEGVGPVQIGDRLTASLNNKKLLEFDVK